MWSHRDPGLRKSGVGNIFVKNLAKSIDNQQLCDTFSKFGNILSCKVSTNAKGEPLGYGFVHYENEEFARKAVEAVNGKLIEGQIVSVAPFKSKAERGTASAKFTNLYIKNLPLDVTEQKLNEMFSKFGTITSLRIMVNDEKKSRGFGFCNFNTHEEAVAAIEGMNNFEIGDKRLFVARAQKREQRDKELRERFEQLKIERQKKYAGVNLYVKNLSDEIDDERLRTEFSSFGSITSAVVMRDRAGKSRGFGFVCFSAQEEAMKAMADMTGRMLDGKPLYVALAQRAEERKARFENRWNQRGMAKGPQPMYAPVPHMGPPRPMVYGGGMMHPGWTNQPIPINRIGGPQMNYALMPAANRNPPRRGGRNQNRGPQGQGQQRQGQNFKYAENVRNQRPEPAVPQPEAAQPTGVTELDFVTSLAALPEERRKVEIGERLYPLVLNYEPEKAPKITGMLLEMENAEIIELLDSPLALKNKVEEALKVLSESEPTDDTA
jgi:polyadenylate-binding protein